MDARTANAALTSAERLAFSKLMVERPPLESSRAHRVLVTPVHEPSNDGSTRPHAGVRAPTLRQLNVDGNAVVALRNADNGRIELALRTPEAFQALDDQLVLEIGNVRATQPRHPGGDLTGIVFTLPAATFAAARNGERLRVRCRTHDTRQWDFGPLDERLLRP